MNVIQWALLLVVLVWIVILYLDRFYDLKSRGAEVSPGMLLWRTKRGIGLLDRIMNVSRRTWKIFGFAGVGLGLFLMGRIFYTLVLNAVSYIESVVAAGAEAGGAAGAGGGVMPIIPGITVPLIAGLIAIMTVLLVHEPAHGIIARRVGLPVKSAGLGLFTVLPLAFVEPDEDELESSSLSQKLQVFGAGSFANILFAFLCFGVILSLVSPLSGLYISAVDENTPAEGTLRPGMQLTRIGFENEPIRAIDEYSDLDNFMENTRPDSRIILVTDNGSFNITLDNQEDENEGYIGISSVWSVSQFELASRSFTSIFMFWETPSLGGGINHYSYNFRIPGFLMGILLWMFIFNLGVGLFNLLPAAPLDGGKMVSAILEKATSSDTARYVSLGISVITFLIIVVNLMPWLSAVW